MPSNRLTGKVAIITGAAQGIGATYAQALAAHGATVVILDILDGQHLADKLTQEGLQALYLQVDVTDPAAVSRAVETIAARHGRLDILVNNASIFGTLPLTPISEIDSDLWDRIMAVNVRGTFECVRAVLPIMRKQAYGKIVNISSGTVFKGAPLMLHYVASKGAIIAMSRSLARELGPDGIRVNTLAPGLIMSDNVRNNCIWQGDSLARNIASRSIQKPGFPEDLIGALLFLASSDSDFVTGQTLVVDGGSIMH